MSSAAIYAIGPGLAPARAVAAEARETTRRLEAGERAE